MKILDTSSRDSKFMAGYIAAAIACFALVQVSFFLPQVLEWELQVMQEGLNLALVARLGLLVLMAAFILKAIAVCEKAGSIGLIPTEGWLSLFVISLVASLMLSIAISHRSSSYVALSHASYAQVEVRKAEKHLGRATPAGDMLRAAMQSVDTLMEQENLALAKKLQDSSHSSRKVMDVASLAYILGTDHPVVSFTVENGLVQEDAIEILSRDVLEHLRQNPALSTDPQVAVLLSRLGD